MARSDPRAAVVTGSRAGSETSPGGWKVAAVLSGTLLSLLLTRAVAQETPGHVSVPVDADPGLDAAYLRGPYPRRPAGPLPGDEGAALEFRYEAEATGLVVLLPVPRRFDVTAPGGRVFTVLALPVDPFDGRIRLAVREGDAERVVLPGERVAFPVSGAFEPPWLVEADSGITVTRGDWTNIQTSKRRDVLKYRAAPVSYRSLDVRWRVREVDAPSGAPVLESGWSAAGGPVESPKSSRLADLRFGHDVWLALGVLREDGASVRAALAVNVTRNVADRGTAVLVRAARWEGIRSFAPGRTETVEIAPEFRDCRSRLLLDLVLTVRQTDRR